MSKRQHKVKFGNIMVPLPATPFLRILLGAGLVLGGIFSFLPVLGIWMLPLGIVVLSIDLPFARRLRRRTDVWWGRSRYKAQFEAWWKARQKRKAARNNGSR